MKAVFFPESWSSNPYLGRLRRALEADGIEIQPVGSDYLSGRWLIHNRAEVDVLHFHWIHYQYRPEPNVGSWSALLKFTGQVAFARLLSYRVVWTLHNLLPHERLQGSIDLAARRAMLTVAHAVLVLCEEGRHQLAERFGHRRGVHVTPHGHYLDVYSDGPTRSQAREALGFEDRDFVYLFFGGIRPHKNVDALVHAFATLAGDELRLVLAGHPHEPALEHRLAELATRDNRVRLDLGFLSESKLLCHISAADVVVLPFQRVLSSGSVITAMSCGRPVIAPSSGCLPEWVTPDCGILYDPEDPSALREAMLLSRDCDLASMGRAAKERVRTFSWQDAARATIVAYDGTHRRWSK